MSTWSNMLDRLYHRDAKHITPHEQQEIDRFMNAPINSTRVIGIGGRLRSGKDTVADYLVEQHGFVKVWMSKPLDDAMKIINPLIYVADMPWTANHWERYSIVREHVDYTEAKKLHEVRRFLQVLGTDFGRKMIHEDVWVDMAADNIQDVLDTGKSVVLTGVRFPNELEMIHRFKGATWWVERPSDDPTTADAYLGEVHESEGSLKWEDFDLPILNDGTLEQLFARADEGLDMGPAEYMTAHDVMTEYMARTAVGQQWATEVVQATADAIKSTGTVIPREEQQHRIITAAPADKILPDISDAEFERLEDLAEKQRTNLEQARMKAEQEKGIEYIPNDEGRTARIDKMHKVAFLSPLTLERKYSDMQLAEQAADALVDSWAPRIIDKIHDGVSVDDALKTVEHIYVEKSVAAYFRRRIEARVEALLDAEESGNYDKPLTRIEQWTEREARAGVTQQAAPTVTKTWDDLMSDMKAHHEA